MSSLKDEQPIEKIKDSAQSVVRSERAPAPVRRYRAVVFQVTLVIVAASFGVLTFLVATLPSFAIDLQITRAIQLINFPLFSWLMSAVSWPGFSPQSVILTGLIVVLIYGLGLRWEAVSALVAAVFETGVNLLVKDLIHRPRPTSALVNVFTPLNSYSFPSGHVMFYICFFGFIGFLVFSLLKPSIKRISLLIFLGVLIVLIGPSRIYLGEHWASDTLGAYLLGSLLLVAIIQFYRWGKTRYFVNQPVVTAEAKAPDKK